jgi:hypothetical protein
MTYARTKLWLGISNVGWIVSFSALALLLNLPASFSPGWLGIGQFVLLYVLLSLPFDLVGGQWIPRRYSRPPVAMVVWIRGAVSQALLYLFFGILILESGTRFGMAGSIVVFLTLTIVLILLQAPLASLTGSMKSTRALDGLYLEARDPSFSGGWTGFPGAEIPVWPSGWRGDLDPELRLAQLTRREGAVNSGSRTRGLALAAIWNLAGFAIALTLAGTGTAASVVRLSLLFTLWSFLGVLILPTPSRAGVHEADEWALRQGIQPVTLARTIDELDRRQDDEPARPASVEAIFHPIPSPSARKEYLRNPAGRRGAWHANRSALYLSWAALNLLSRAVHCNSGRPELWVLLPAD